MKCSELTYITDIHMTYLIILLLVVFDISQAHMSFWDLHNAVAASQVKIGVLEEELAKEKTRKEFHRALIKVAKKAAGAHFF